MDFPSIPLTEPVLIIAAVLLLVLVLPLLGHAIRTPDIILLILAGMLFGPHGLHLLERGQAIEVWGTVGLMYIMFLAGLEVNVSDFMRHRNRSAVVGGLSFLVPQVAGAIGAVWLLGFDWTKAILLASMLASFTLLTYPQVSRLGLARQESVTTTVGGVLITDTLALLVLAVIVDLHGQDSISWLFIIRLALSFSVFLLLMIKVVPLLGHWFFHNAARDGGAQFLFVLVVAFLAGALSGLAGVEPIIGAFLAGVTLNRLVPPQSALMNRISFVGENLFIPFFLISVGMIVNPRVFLSDAETWKVGAFMVIAVCATKWVASKLAQVWLGYSRDEGWMIFGLTVTQAAATLAAVMVGYQIGIFDEAVLNGTLMMILATCMLSPFVTEHFARKVALQSPVHDSHTQESGRILIPVDNPETAERILELAILLRPENSVEPIFPLRVVRSNEQDQTEITRNEKMMMGVIAQATAADAPVSPSVRVAAGVAEGIQRATVELRTSSVLLGWPKTRSIGSALLGGVLNDVLQTCQSRVAVCNISEPLNTLSRVLVAIPPNAEREAGFRETLLLIWRLTNQIGAELTILAPKNSHAAIQGVTQSLKPALTPVWPEAKGWTDACRKLLSDHDHDCMRILLTAREGGVSWHPGMSRLPKLLLAANHTASTLMIYPPLPTADENGSSEPAQKLEDIVTIGGAHKAEQSETFAACIPALLQSSMAPAEVPSCQKLLADAAQEFPIELAPGVALVHAHTELLHTSTLYILSSRDPMPLSEVQADLVFVLLGPVAGPPDQHLQILSALARFMRDPEPLHALRTAKDDGALRKILHKNLATIELRPKQ
jgi:Kef-type K+ transport system membrane component KefB/mannitol/fructose-specific phosphotransferase system IIA component (Ntr-type)